MPVIFAVWLADKSSLKHLMIARNLLSEIFAAL